MRWRSILTLGLPIGLALYAISSHLLLQIGATLPRFLFPLCIGLGGLAASGLRPATVIERTDSLMPKWLDTWLPWIAAGLLFIAIALMVYGAVSSTARDWDGFVTWSLKARYLVPPTSLQQPHFTDPAIYSYGLTYPPLQPLCLGSMQGLLGERPGRLLFPLLYLACIATVFTTLREHGLRRSEAWLGALAFGLTPMWLNRGAGSVDSGYADLWLGYAATLAAAGLLRADHRLLFLGAMFLPLIKPEGTAYALALSLITAVAMPARQHFATAWGLCLALLLWLPLRTGANGMMLYLVPLLLLAFLLALHAAARRWSRSTLLGAGCGVVILSIVVVYITEDSLRSSQHLLLRDFIAHIPDLGDRLTRLPELLRGYANGALSLSQYGLLFILLPALLILPRRLTGPTPCRPLTALLVAGLAMACLAMLLSPDPDLEHVFKSRFDRLLLHWVGPGWLLITAWTFNTPPATGSLS